MRTRSIRGGWRNRGFQSLPLFPVPAAAWRCLCNLRRGGKIQVSICIWRERDRGVRFFGKKRSGLLRYLWIEHPGRGKPRARCVLPEHECNKRKSAPSPRLSDNFVGSKAQWHEITDDLPQFNTAPRQSTSRINQRGALPGTLPAVVFAFSVAIARDVQAPSARFRPNRPRQPWPPFQYPGHGRSRQPVAHPPASL